MQAVVVSILMLGLLCFVVKLSLKSKPVRWLWSALVAVATGMMGSVASRQSRTAIADFLATPSAMADAAVLITIDVALFVAYCIAEGRAVSPSPTSTYGSFPERIRRVLLVLLRFFPGIVFFVSILSMLTWFMFTLTGISFALTSWVMAAAVLLLISVLTWGIEKLFPQRSLRLEVLFLMAMIMGGMGIVATVNGRTAVEGTASIAWPQLATVLLLCVAGIVLGLVAYHRKNKIKLS